MRQRFLKSGLESFADHEALELLLYYAIPRQDTNPIAHRLMERYGSLTAVLSAPAEDLKKVEGIGESAAVLLKSGHAPAGRFANDFICREGCVYRLSSKRLPDRGQSHGTGCTLSSALAAALALEMPWKSALCEAKAFVLGSLAEYVEIGPGVPAMYPPVDDRVEQVRLEKL